jgi:hypothetical protein
LWRVPMSILPLQLPLIIIIIIIKLPN